ncbi:hypothetical protein HIM_10716 [Hirsutella minnesotensis 3608]|uniref:Phospholipase n=1 Tax=Hirsutella minnesotensis 3608 TaxID=1043627 RepID=A0A0F7ZRM7_9HYPO|nr:hypothetical protein HIM_10716 [Hirsutella minnesotensis 3608]
MGPKCYEAPTPEQLVHVPTTSGLGFDYSEHAWLGDHIKLSFRTETGHKAVLSGSCNAFKASCGEQDLGYYMSYGVVCALAGNFFGVDPISDEPTADDRERRFMAAFKALRDENSVTVETLVDYLANKRISFNSNRLKWWGAVSALKLDAITLLPTKSCSYPNLAAVNAAQFGESGRKAYIAGHAAAIHHATGGKKTKERLFEAYYMNAFADHFLQDLFAAGLARTPQRALEAVHSQDNSFLASNSRAYEPTAMPDEDCYFNLTFENDHGAKWRAYGGKRLMDNGNEVNQQRCREAVQNSANEVFLAWSEQRIIPESEFDSLKLAPRRAVPDKNRNNTPLFRLTTDGNDVVIENGARN